MKYMITGLEHKKKVLFITYDDPSFQNNGDRIYTYNILKVLTSYCYVHIVLYKNSGINETGIDDICSSYEVVDSSKKNLLSFIFSLKPSIIVNRLSHHFIKVIQNNIIKNDYDLVIINHFKLSYLIDYLNKNNNGTKFICVTHNIEYLVNKSVYLNHNNLALKIVYFIEALKTRYYEKKYLQKYNSITAITDQDKEYLLSVYKIRNVTIIPPVLPNTEQYINNSRNIIYSGSFTWEPKKQNLIRFLNADNFNLLVDNKITLHIVGKANNDFVKYVNNNYNNVIMTGEVKSTKDYYKKCSIAIIPEKSGGGFKLKILEAMMFGKVVIALHSSINSSLLKNNVHLYTVHSNESLIECIIANIDKDNSALLNNAKQIILKEFSYSSLQNKLKEITDAEK